jgi:hypothetical protein
MIQPRPARSTTYPLGGPTEKLGAFPEDGRAPSRAPWRVPRRVSRPAGSYAGTAARSAGAR